MRKGGIGQFRLRGEGCCLVSDDSLHMIPRYRIITVIDFVYTYEITQLTSHQKTIAIKWHLTDQISLPQPNQPRTNHEL